MPDDPALARHRPSHRSLLGRARAGSLLLIALALCVGVPLQARAQAAFGLGGLQLDDAGGLAIDGDGNIYLIGRFRQTVDFDPGAGVFSLTATSGFSTFIASFDDAGALRYAFAVDSASSVPERDIAVDAAGNIYVTGVFSGTADFDPGVGVEVLNSSSGNIFVASYDDDGDYRFAFNLGVTSVVAEIGAAIAVDTAGNSYITGEFTGETDFDPTTGEFLLEAEGISDVFVASYSSAGTLRFAIGVGGTQRDRGMDIAIDAAGNSYVTGAFRDSVDFDPGVGSATWVSVGSEDLFLASYDDAGNYRYAIGAGSALTDIGQGVAVDAAGNAFVTGQFTDQADFDPGPGTLTLTSGGNEDLFVASYDGTGALRFAFGVGNSNPVLGLGAAVDASGAVHVTGSFRNAVDFDPGPGEAILVAGTTRALVARYSNAGAYLDAYAFEATSGSSSIGYGIALSPAGRAHVIGTYSGTVDLDPGPGDASVSSNGSSDVFVSSLTAASEVPVVGALGAAAMVGLLGLIGWRNAFVEPG